MRKVILWNHVSLDGFFAGPDGDISFFTSTFGPELEAHAIGQNKTAGGLLFGRSTYEHMFNYWPSATGEVADFMNSIPKVVFSRTLQRADWNNTRLVKTDAVAEVVRLKSAPGKDLFIFGSGDLASHLSAAGLIDEYRLGLAPVFLGRGKRLFEGKPHALNLRLVESRPLSPRCLLLRYAPEPSARPA